MIRAIAVPMEVTGALAALEAPVMDKAEALARLVGALTVAYLQSYTGEMRPPIHKGDPPRAAHPGHWGDVTKRLAFGTEGEGGYHYEVRREGNSSIVLTLSNPTPYAVYLERREGFWVLTGVTKSGGPVDQALMKAAAEVGLEIQLVHL